jgi:superfamily II DNA or RNA helicase
VEPLQIIVDRRIRVPSNGLTVDIISELKEGFEHKNPEFFKRLNLGLPLWNVPKVIRTWEEESKWDKSWITFPRGGLQRVRDVLDTYEIDRSILDKRTLGESAVLDPMPDHNVELYPYQVEMRDKGIEAQTCILKAGTGSGKTTVAFAIAGKLKLPTLVMVSTRALFDQWFTRAQKEMGLKKKEIGIIRGSTMRLAVLTIAMQKTLSLRVPLDEDLAKFFGLFIVDEVQLAAASTFIKAIDPVHAKYRIGISADHRRKDGKEFLVVDEFGPVAHEVSRQQLIESKHIVDTEIRVIPTDFAAPWYGMPTDNDDEEVPNDEKELDFDRLLKEMNDDDARNDRALQAIRMGLDQGEQVLVMAHRREHCRVLDQQLVRNGIKTGFLIGGDDYRKQFVETRELFEKGKLQVAVGTFQAIGYGIDLPKAAVVVCATPIAGNKFFFNQVRGRICRLAKNKTDSWVYYLWDKQVYGARHLRNLIKWNNKRVQVWSGEAGWIDGKTYLKMEKENAKA